LITIFGPKEISSRTLGYSMARRVAMCSVHQVKVVVVVVVGMMMIMIL
jgi:hypothetical protein